MRLVVHTRSIPVLLLLFSLFSDSKTTVLAQQSNVPFKVGVGVAAGAVKTESCTAAEQDFINEQFASYTIQLARLFFRDDTLILGGDFTEINETWFDKKAFEDFNTFEKQKFDNKPRTTVLLGADATDTATDDATDTTTEAPVTQTPNIPPPTDADDLRAFEPILNTTLKDEFDPPPPPPPVVADDDETETTASGAVTRNSNGVVMDADGVLADGTAPIAAAPVVSDAPVTASPVTASPLTASPVTAPVDDTATAPIVAPVGDATTDAPVTASPVTDPPVVVAPVGAAAMASDTAPVVVVSDATASPVTASPVSDPPVVVAPVGEAAMAPVATASSPVTAAPDGDATDSPITASPVTASPVTNFRESTRGTPITGAASVTGASVTGAPVTDAPVTDAPVSEAPVSGAPVSEAPISEAPVTGAPVTGAPVSAAPVTEAPVTEAPVTTVTGDDLFADVDHRTAPPPCQNITQECIVVDFEELPGGTPLARGQYVSDEWRAAYGLTITVQGHGVPGADFYTPKKSGTDLQQARIFDTAVPGTQPDGDQDLGSPNQACPGGGPGIGPDGVPGRIGENCEPLGNVLIIQEHNIKTPDDANKGGNFTLDFDDPVTFSSVGFLDVNLGWSTVYVECHRTDGTKVISSVSKTGKNAVSTVHMAGGAGVEDVIKVVIVMYRESGAVTHFDFCIPQCSDVEPDPVYDDNTERLLLQQQRLPKERRLPSDNNAGLDHDNLVVDVLGDSAYQEEHRRELRRVWDKYNFVYAGMNTWNCKFCNDEATDARRGLRRQQSRQEEEVQTQQQSSSSTYARLQRSLTAATAEELTEREFLISALESVMSFGLTVDLSWNWKEWLENSGYEVGCLGDGHFISVVFELMLD